MAVGSTSPWWAPVDAPVCEVPGRAVRRDEVLRPRVRTLAAVLAEMSTETPAETPTGPATAGGAAAGDDPDRRRARPAGPDAVGFAAARATAVRLVGAVAETAAGRRPAQHLASILDPATRAALVPPLRALAGVATRAGPVRVTGVSASAVEVSATVHGPTRSRALVARLEREPDGPAWRVRLLTLL